MNYQTGPITDYIMANNSDFCENALEKISRMASELTVTKIGTIQQKTLIADILEVAEEAGRIAPITTLELLGRITLWVSTSYIPAFAKATLKIQRFALAEDPAKTFVVLEHALMVCYCLIITRNITGSENPLEIECCLEWQRRIFGNIISVIENNPIIEKTSAINVLKLSCIISDISPELDEINKHMKFLIAELES